eukprot:Skav202778  [mRNA]  locus=scaffold326:374063:377913:- [translate_table: standard]
MRGSVWRLGARSRRGSVVHFDELADHVGRSPRVSHHPEVASRPSRPTPSHHAPRSRHGKHAAHAAHARSPSNRDASEFPVKLEVPGGVFPNNKKRRSGIAVGFLAAMPDVHLGKGATIGSVFASRDYVCPNAVGVDIGCGMCNNEEADLPAFTYSMGQAWGDLTSNSGRILAFHTS